MKKKFCYVVSAALVFFAGAILSEIFPSIGSVATFVGVSAGFTCGYFFMKETMKDIVEDYEETISELKEKISNLQQVSTKKSKASVKES